jgi:hypothetical protein
MRARDKHCNTNLQRHRSLRLQPNYTHSSGDMIGGLMMTAVCRDVRAYMQAAQYLLDDHTMATIAESLRCAVERLAQQGDMPWATAAGASFVAALSHAHGDLQVAALSSCPDQLIASAPIEVLRPALAARCTTRGEPPLLEFALPSCLLATPQACSQFTTAAPALTQVQSVVIDAEGVEHTAVHLRQAVASLSALPSLVALQLRDAALDLADLACLTMAPCGGRLRCFKARRLRLSRSDPGAVGSFFGQLCNLQQLQLFDCASLTDTDMQHFSLLTGLQLLDLTDESRISSNALAHLATMTGLVHLSLNGCFLVKDGGLLHLTALTRLSYLDLWNCSEIGDAGLAHVAAPTRLSHLDLFNCFQIGNAGLAHLAALTGLSNLNLCGSEHVGDGGLVHLAALTGLLSLDLCGCLYIGNGGIAHLAALTGLEFLDLSSCFRLGDDGLAHLAALTRLTYLGLDQCDQISDVGLAHLDALTRLVINVDCLPPDEMDDYADLDDYDDYVDEDDIDDYDDDYGDDCLLY